MRSIKNKKTVQRLKIAKGHLEKIISMVENGSDITEVDHQLLAVQAALREVEKIVLREHMETYVKNLKTGEAKEVVEEFIRVLQSK